MKKQAKTNETPAKPMKRLTIGMLTAALGLIWGAHLALADTLPQPADMAALYANAKKEGSMVYYHSGPPEPMRLLVQDFQKQYPGISVSVIRPGSGTAPAQRYADETQAGQYIADVVMMSDYPTMVQFVQGGQFAAWKVPNYDKIPAGSRIGTTAYAPYLNDIAIGYNPNKVTPAELQMLRSSWASIADPRFKGRFAVTSQPCGNCFAAIGMLLDTSIPGFGPNLLKAIADNKPGIFNDVNVSLDRTIAGDYDIVFWSFEAALIPKWQAGAPIRWTHPSPTPLFANSFLAVAAHAPHPNAARLFVDWLFSDQGARMIEKDMGAVPSLEGIPDERPVTKESWYQPITKVYVVDMNNWSANYDKDMALWAKLLKQGQQGN